MMPKRIGSIFLSTYTKKVKALEIMVNSLSMAKYTIKISSVSKLLPKTSSKFLRLLIKAKLWRKKLRKMM